MRNKLSGNHEKGGVMTWIIGLVAVLLIVFGIAALMGPTAPQLNNLPGTEPQGGAPGATGVEDQVTVTDINNNTDAYLGRTVTLNGEVDTVYSDRLFRLDQEGTIIGDEILVIARNQIPAGTDRTPQDPLFDADDVLVRGEVQRFVTADIERDLGLDLDPELEVDFEGQTVIVADQVIRQPENP